MLSIRILGRIAPRSSRFALTFLVTWLLRLPLSLFAMNQPLAAFKLCLSYSSLWLPSSFACYKAAFCCLQVLLAIQHPLAAFQLWLLHSSLWLSSSFDCYTAGFGCLQALLVKQQPSTAYTSAFGCLQAMLAIQQPLAAFKLCLLYSSQGCCIGCRRPSKLYLLKATF